MALHDVMRNVFVAIAKNARFHVSQKQTHVLLLPTLKIFMSSTWHCVINWWCPHISRCCHHQPHWNWFGVASCFFSWGCDDNLIYKVPYLSVRPWRSSGPSQTDDRAQPDKTGSRSCPVVLLRGEDPVFAGPGPRTPGVRCVRACMRLSRSWNPGPESRISRSWNPRSWDPMSVYRGSETQVLRAKWGNMAITKEGSHVRLSESWNPAVTAPNRTCMASKIRFSG